ncbi:unnamed protein product, partial [marine sediment metagenome]
MKKIAFSRGHVLDTGEGERLSRGDLVEFIIEAKEPKWTAINVRFIKRADNTSSEQEALSIHPNFGANIESGTLRSTGSESTFDHTAGVLRNDLFHPSSSFVASSHWEGPKPGFYFTNGSLGQGYYSQAARSNHNSVQTKAPS